MLFNSYIFIFAFLPLTFVLYFYLHSREKHTEAKAFLVLDSSSKLQSFLGADLCKKVLIAYTFALWAAPIWRLSLL